MPYTDACSVPQQVINKYGCTGAEKWRVVYNARFYNLIRDGETTLFASLYAKHYANAVLRKAYKA